MGLSQRRAEAVRDWLLENFNQLIAKPVHGSAVR